MTLAPVLFPLIPTPPSPPPADPLCRSSECPGVLMGTSCLSPPRFRRCCSLYLAHSLIPSPNDQPTPPHPSGLSREAVSPGSLSSGLSPYPVHPLYHFAPFTLLVPPSGSGPSPPQVCPEPSTSSASLHSWGHHFTHTSLQDRHSLGPPQCHYRPQRIKWYPQLTMLVP